MKKFDYSKEDLRKSLMKVGIGKGDNIFIYSNLGFFGKLKDAYDEKSYCSAFKDMILDLLGNEGTLVIPTYSYSYFNNQIFDKDKTQSVCGIFSEFIRNDSHALRSDDPNFSVSVIGKRAKFFTENCSLHSFGKNCFWERLLNVGGKLCRFNLSPDYNTFIHYVEKTCKVPYRYDKAFKGKSMINGHKELRTHLHFVRDLSDSNLVPDLKKLDQKSKKLGLLKEVSLGKGIISCMTCRETFNLIVNELQRNPNFLITGEYEES